MKLISVSGGNCDIKNLSRGSKVYLPIHVKGAKFSVGDLHFSQGDGEISFCGAIEMSGVVTINFKVMVRFTTCFLSSRDDRKLIQQCRKTV